MIHYKLHFDKDLFQKSEGKKENNPFECVGNYLTFKLTF